MSDPTRLTAELTTEYLTDLRKFCVEHDEGPNGDYVVFIDAIFALRTELAQAQRDYSASQAHVAELSLEERDLRAELTAASKERDKAIALAHSLTLEVAQSLEARERLLDELERHGGDL